MRDWHTGVDHENARIFRADKGVSEMSNKDKKARKKSRGFKPSPSKSEKDSITGLFADAGGGNIYSDRVYNQDTYPLYGRLFGHDNLEVETELGKDTIIMTKGMYDYSGGGTLNARKTSFQRIALLGSFEYDRKGRFKKGEIREIGSWTFSKTTEGAFIGETGSVDIGQALLPNLMSVNSGLQSTQNRQFDYLLDGEFQEGDSRNDFLQYESAKYFAGNWWDNPFTPNLI